MVFEDGGKILNLTAEYGAEVVLRACWTGEVYSVFIDARDFRGNGILDVIGTDVVVATNRKYTVGGKWDLPNSITNQVASLLFDGWRYVKANGTLSEVPYTVPPQSDGVTNIVATWRLGDSVGGMAEAVGASGLAFGSFGTAGDEGRWTESRYDADWFVQTNVVHCGNEAAQSGSVPASNDRVHASWLTTSVRGKGELSFWWKCEAPDPIDGKGDGMYFGILDNTNANLTVKAEISGTSVWTRVFYVNDSTSDVTFAWKFQNNGGRGGGVGWVDCVVWTPKDDPGEFVITLDSQGGTGGDGSLDVTYGKVFPEIHEKLPKRAGLSLYGYYTEPNGGGIECWNWDKYWVCDNTLFTSNTTIYAYWKQNPTVTFVLNGGTLVNGWSETTNCEVGVTFELPTENDIAKEGYDFKGWYRDSEFVAANLVTELEIRDFEPTNIVLYAKWDLRVEQNYEVQYYLNLKDHEFVSRTINLTNGKLERYEDIEFTYKEDDGFKFAGWNTEFDGSGNSYPDGYTFNSLEEIRKCYENVEDDILILYAQWIPAGSDPGEDTPWDEETEVHAMISVTNQTAYISWWPDLRTNTPPRKYSVLHTSKLPAKESDWAVLPEEPKYPDWAVFPFNGRTNQFFKVKLRKED